MPELPHNLEAERALLSLLLFNNKALEDVATIIQSEYFYLDTHSIIFDRIKYLVDKKLQASPITLTSALSEQLNTDDFNIQSYLKEIILQYENEPLDIISLASEIREFYIRRRGMLIADDMKLSFYTIDQTDMADKVEKAERELFQLAITKGKEIEPLGSILHSIKIHVHKMVQEGHQVTGLDTGLIDLNKIISGLHNSDLIILAARPAMGKTSLAIKIGYNIAMNFLHDQETLKRVLFFSLEMSAEQIASKILSFHSKISTYALRSGYFKNKLEDMKKLVDSTHALQNLPILIDDTAGLTIIECRNKIRRAMRKHNVGLVIVDYLQLMNPNVKIGMNKVHEIGEISKGLKEIAKEFNIPVLALSQLSRNVESREDKRPLLSDLRDSGSIEQDADIVMFLYREEYYTKDNAEKEAVKNIAELNIAKHRHGPIGSLKLYFDHDTTNFKNLVC